MRKYVYSFAFVTMIVNYLTQDGVIERGRLYEAPFTNITSTGPDNIFDNENVIKLFNIIDDIKLRAVA
jgi:type I restriction enzyme R subunit